jgi:hypothetical protein
MIKLKPFFLEKDLSLDPIGPHVLRDYQQWFARPRRDQGGMVRPRTLEEIKAWVVEISKNRKNCYFSIRTQGENIGHLGIREINREDGEGELDIFLAKTGVRGSLEKKALTSWLSYFLTVHLGLSQLVVPDPDEELLGALREAGFKPIRGGRQGFAVYKLSS